MWQMFWPESFFRDFPGWGRHWVSVDGPYNEHLLRDVGQGNLAFGVVALVALLTGGVWLARATGLAAAVDRKSTRLNSSHANISYAVFCLKKKKKHICEL